MWLNRFFQDYTDSELRARDAEYREFADAYGYDVTEWSEFEVLQATLEINMTTWLMQNIDESPEIAAEYQVRMATLRIGERDRAWKPF